MEKRIDRILIIILLLIFLNCLLQYKITILQKELKALETDVDNIYYVLDERS